VRKRGVFGGDVAKGRRRGSKSRIMDAVVGVGKKGTGGGSQGGGDHQRARKFKKMRTESAEKIRKHRMSACIVRREITSGLTVPSQKKQEGLAGKVGLGGVVRERRRGRKGIKKERFSAEWDWRAQGGTGT